MISKDTMNVLNELVNGIFEKLAREAGQLTTKYKKKTLSALELQGAVRLLFPGEFAKHAIDEGTRAVDNLSA